MPMYIFSCCMCTHLLLLFMCRASPLLAAWSAQGAASRLLQPWSPPAGPPTRHLPRWSAHPGGPAGAPSHPRPHAPSHHPRPCLVALQRPALPPTQHPGGAPPTQHQGIRLATQHQGTHRRTLLPGHTLRRAAGEAEASHAASAAGEGLSEVAAGALAVEAGGASRTWREPMQGYLVTCMILCHVGWVNMLKDTRSWCCLIFTGVCTSHLVQRRGFAGYKDTPNCLQLLPWQAHCSSPKPSTTCMPHHSPMSETDRSS
jgi:hypothetical protein